MATYRRRGDKWRVEVCKNGIRHSATFDTKGEASGWAAKIENMISEEQHGLVPDRPFGDALSRYAEKVSTTKRGERWETIRLAKLGEDPVAEVSLRELSPHHFAAWRDRRLAEVSAASVLREWTLLSSVCTKCVKEWGWLRSNPMSNVQRPKAPPARTRRVSDDEIKLLCHTLGWPGDTDTARVAAAFMFATETAMRAGEICRMRWSDIKGRVVHVPFTKNGHPRDVPLSSGGTQTA